MRTKACLSRPNTSNSRFTKPPSSRNCKQHRMWELGRHGRWNKHTKPSYNGKIVSFVEVKACAGRRVTLFERLGWKTLYLVRTLANQLQSSHKDNWAFYASVDGLSLGTIKSRRYSFLKSAWRDHTRFSVQIVTKSTFLHCSRVEIHPYEKKQLNLVGFTDT